MNFSLCLTLALLLDVALGDPLKLPHPVTGIGKIILLYESKLYRDDFKQGLIFCACVVFSTGLIALILSLLAALISNYALYIFEVYALYAAIAWRSLKDETLPVATSLMQNDLAQARYYLSRVVGRDTENAQPPEIIRAAIETIAENLIDGVISPLFWATLGYLMFKDIGLIVCVWMFKAASTLDSMVGYDNERYKNFGTASARLDDILNFLPARIGGVMIILAGLLSGMNFVNGVKAFIRDRKKHKSPNSAHGESAFAGLLGLKLGGGAYYDKVFEARPWLGEGLEVKEPDVLDILNAHKLMDASVALSAVIMLLIAEL
ncbi:MAG: cobalamin biosynthesis protein CobD [Synergistaceae bacterium]|nr:cobalamin biosynthesis protein CobD [Synergistaceae bacterium]